MKSSHELKFNLQNRKKQQLVAQLKYFSYFGGKYLHYKIIVVHITHLCYE